MTERLTRAQVADLCGIAQRDLPREPNFSLTHYEPPGPVGAAYIRSQGPIDAIQGPGGSGKTVASLFKKVRLGIGATPICKDGVVRAKITVVRDNYRNLYRTTLLSWFEWFPPDFQGSIFSGGQDRPARHELRLSTVREWQGARREVPVDLIFDFFAIGDQTIENLLKSYETSYGYLNEADQMHIRVPTFLFGRTGRYPKRDDLADPLAQRLRVVSMDFNPMRPTHPLHKACTAGTFRTGDAIDDGITGKDMAGAGDAKRVINFFQQPSGLSADAENRRGKTFEEYQQDMQVMNEDDARRMVLGLPGFSLDGKPVYARDFNRQVHIAGGRLQVLPGKPIHIGFDQDLSPAAVLFQIGPMGQLRILREVWMGHQVGIPRFTEEMARVLREDFAGLPPGQFTSDPAGFYGADKAGGEVAWSQAVGAALGHAIYPAWTNEVKPRQDVLRVLLSQMIDAQTPKVIIDPFNEMLIEGFEAEYKFPKHRDNAATEFGDRVVKNNHANVMDALQYGVMGFFGRDFFIDQITQAGRPGNVTGLHARARTSARRDFSVWEV